MPRVRFTLRAMMIAVAIVAVIFGGEMMRRRRASYLKRAANEAEGERLYRAQAEGNGQEVSYLDSQVDWARRQLATVRRIRAASKPGDPQVAEIGRGIEKMVMRRQKDADEFRLVVRVIQAQADYHGDLRRKYENSARRPWWGVSSDPVEPDWNARLPASFQSGSLPPIPDAPPSPRGADSCRVDSAATGGG